MKPLIITQRFFIVVGIALAIVGAHRLGYQQGLEANKPCAIIYRRSSIAYFYDPHDLDRWVEKGDKVWTRDGKNWDRIS